MNIQSIKVTSPIISSLYTLPVSSVLAHIAWYKCLLQEYGGQKVLRSFATAAPFRLPGKDLSLMSLENHCRSLQRNRYITRLLVLRAVAMLKFRFLFFLLLIYATRYKICCSPTCEILSRTSQLRFRYSFSRRLTLMSVSNAEEYCAAYRFRLAPYGPTYGGQYPIPGSAWLILWDTFPCACRHIPWLAQSRVCIFAGPFFQADIFYGIVHGIET